MSNQYGFMVWLTLLFAPRLADGATVFLPVPDKVLNSKQPSVAWTGVNSSEGRDKKSTNISTEPAITVPTASTANTSTSTANISISSFFCWTVGGEADRTLTMAWHQMQECGGRVIFSNYSDPERDTIQIYNGSMQAGKTPGGWADNTNMFLKAWKYIAESDWPDHFMWFVKIDADTFIRPRYLVEFAQRFDPTEPVGLMVEGRIRGALEVQSFKTFRHPNTSFLYTRETDYDKNPYLGGEDVWLGHAMNKSGMRLVDSGSQDGCISGLLSYFNLPLRFRDLPKTVGGTSNLPPAVIAEGDVNPHDPKYNDKNRCVHPDVLAVHPVKDVSVYNQFLKVDQEKQGIQQLSWRA